jgi:predicted HicB family RNase H-like nuclease
VPHILGMMTTLSEIRIAQRAPRGESIHVRVEPALRLRAEAAAAAAGVSLSDLVRHAVQEASRSVLKRLAEDQES